MRKSSYIKLRQVRYEVSQIKAIFQIPILSLLTRLALKCTVYRL